MNKHTHKTGKLRHVAAFYCETFRAVNSHGAVIHSDKILSRLNSVENEQVQKVAVLGYN
jgi:hypothetical protein